MGRFCLGLALLPVLSFIAFLAGALLFFTVVSVTGQEPIGELAPAMEIEGPEPNFEEELPPRALTATAEFEDRTGADILERATAAADPANQNGASEEGTSEQGASESNADVTEELATVEATVVVLTATPVQ